MRTHRHATTLVVGTSRPTVFEFFADANNLNEITPPWLSFSILTPLPIVMRRGTRIDYRLRLHGIPFAWQTEITVWEPPVRFVDEQRRGPYRSWRHEHRFEPCDGGTRIVDEVEYVVPGWILEPLVHRGMVRRDIVRIFSYRTACLRRRFGDVDSGTSGSAPDLRAGGLDPSMDPS
ncbi:MAG: SRPBCC family protein [Planctomycetota bacterium]